MWLWAAIACSSPYEVPDGAVAYTYDPLAEFSTFPDDVQTVADASTATGLRVALLDVAADTLQAVFPPTWTLVDALGGLDGFGTTAAVSLRFSAPVDAATADIDWRRLDTNEVVPYSLRTTDDGATLLIEPALPLAGETQYVLLVRGLAAIDGTPVFASPVFHDLARGRSPDPRFDAVAEVLAAQIDGDDRVVAGTVFTTQSLTGDDDAVKAAIAAESPVWTPGDCSDDGGIRRCEASLSVIDFLGDDQQLAAGEIPSPQRHYSLPVSVWLPSGEGPFPVVIYGHGLGEERQEGRKLARDVGVAAGFAVVAIDAPRHGGHPFSSANELQSILGFFGVTMGEQAGFDVAQLRDHFRAATWDKLQLLTALRAGVAVDGRMLDSSSIGYSGHSLGAVMGVSFLALSDVGAGELSVPGGRVSEIVQYGGTFAPLINTLRPEAATDGDVDRFFPMLQTAIERGDAANYAARAVVGRDVLMQLVLDDDIIPNSTTAYLARAMDLSVAPTVVYPVKGVPVLGRLPASGNRDGNTAVLFEFDEMLDGDTWVPASHGYIHDNEVGIAQLDPWWRSVFAGTPAVVVDPYSVLARP